MLCSQFFTRLLPTRVRRQVPDRLPRPASSQFLVRSFRLVDPSTSRYQSCIDELRYQEVYPFGQTPYFDDMDGESHRNKRAKTESTEPKKPICGICLSDIEGPCLTPCLKCHATYCSDCVRKQFEMALKDNQQMPPRCCRRVLHHDVAKGILPEAQFEQYKKKYDESITPNPFYCPKPTCSAFIPPRNLKPIRGKITCNTCETVSCIKCKQVASNHHMCTNSTEEDDIVKQFGYKRCPKCNTAAMKMYGCPHVRCISCHAHWCYDCQRPINVCYVKPCSRARDEGDMSEVDDGDTISDDEDTGSVQNVPVANPNPVDNTAERAPLSETNLPQQNRQDDQVSARAAASNVDLPRPAAESLEIATVSASAANSTSPATENQTTSLPLPELASEAAVTADNLDDPNRVDVDWEADDLDFGEEPTDENWDIWGCLHRFDPLTIKKIPHNWRLNLDTSKVTEIDCMSCFKNMKLNPSTSSDSKEKEHMPSSRVKTASENQGTETITTVQSPEGWPGTATPHTVSETTDEQTSNNLTEAKQRAREDKKKAIYHCQICGVLFCWWCRRLALRQAERYRKDTGIRE